MFCETWCCSCKSIAAVSGEVEGNGCQKFEVMVIAFTLLGKRGKGLGSARTSQGTSPSHCRLLSSAREQLLCPYNLDSISLFS
jgi:hypothetical protein